MLLWIIWSAVTIGGVVLLLASTLLASTPLLRRAVAVVAGCALVAGAGAVLFVPTFVWHVLLLEVIQLFLLFEVVRTFRNARPRSVVINTAALLLVLVAAVALLFVTQGVLLWSVLVVSSVVAIISLLQVRTSLLRYRLKDYKYEKPPLEDMPTVSVCVPARNETFALAGCLDAILASDYPKLEVIVLDDCSQDTTSQMIKSYAHAGVRFVQGVPPKEGWLGRNQACDVLLNQSSGKYVLFVDVDTRIEPRTISRLVDYALLRRLTMISVLPERRDTFRASVFLAPLRYFWQMIVPQFIHTPAATALWMVRRKKLLELGGFTPSRGDIMPENAFARAFDLYGTYRYLLEGHKLGVYYEKKWRSQIETSMRLSYPALWKQPFAVLLVTLAIYACVMVPLIVLVSEGDSLTLAGVVAVGNLVAYMLAYVLYARRAWHQGWLLAGLLLPFTILQEIAVIIASMVGYEFDRIRWKGRNICYPVLRR